MRNEKEITILGAGLVGSLLSMYLVKEHMKVEVFEKRRDPRKAQRQEGRSINLALSHRGLHALEKVGLREKAQSLAIPMKGRMMHSTTGELTFQPYGKEGQFINSISRSELNHMLITEAESQGVIFNFNKPCSGINIDEEYLELDGIPYDLKQKGLVIGSDGAFSMLRQVMQKRDRFSFSQDYLDHAYKELTINPVQGDFALDPHALHIWPRGGFMLIALPNQDKSFTCTLFLSWEGKESFDNLNSKEAVMIFFEKYFRDVIPLIPDLADQFQSNPTASLVSTSCFPWSSGKFTLIGDAAHAIVPFYGQGMNAGFEDCRLFMEHAKSCGFEWINVLKAFERSRKPNADAIKQLALQNFIEMRDKVGQDQFLRQKSIEAELNNKYPDQWIPQYSMVTFSDIDYSEALQDGNLKNEVMESYLCQSSEEGVDHRKIMDAYLAKRSKTASV
jgi:kynurenine 3-monooxygenase